ncbi:MAG: ABC transporter ATP-binding protein [Halobacteriales archaeon]|nr:ABC transporter ATP-binding protein [Halobacteriales archaeon]
MIELKNVTKMYGDTVALNDVSLRVSRGEVHALVGPNGSGKTTLLDIALGRVAPDSGEVVRDGKVGCAFQEPRVLDDLTVAENISVFGADEELAEKLRLDRVYDRRASALSGGFRKKLDTVLALADEPETVLFDEPLDELDDVSKRRLVELVGEYADGGNAVLVSTHRLDDFDCIDRLTVLYDGEVLLSSPTDELDVTPQEAYLRAVERHENS